MPVIKCKMCGGDIQLAKEKTFEHANTAAAP